MQYLLKLKSESSMNYWFKLYYIIALATLFTVPAGLIAQSQQRTLAVEIAYSGLTDEVGVDLKHRERNYLIGVGYHLSPRWSLGLQGTLIRTNFRRGRDMTESAALVGLHGELDLVPQSKHRFVLKLGSAVGDYCTCGDELPRRQSGLVYARYGVGLHIVVLNPLQLTLGFEGNTILSKVRGDYDYNLFTIGLRMNNWLRLG